MFDIYTKSRSPQKTLEVWHGGGSYFTHFEEDAIGSGEGDSMGWGFYFAENRAGGEYFARYMHTRKNGFLYRADLVIADDEIIDLDSSFRDSPTEIRCRISRVFRSCEWEDGLHAAYWILRKELGDEGASKYLRNEGVMALRSHEGTNYDHGVTHLVLDNSRIIIREAFKLEIQPYDSKWLPLIVNSQLT